MGVYVRTYQSLGDVEPGQQFFARAIADEASKKGAAREGFSVCFYGATEDEAAGKASAWIKAERDKHEAAEKRYAAFGLRNRRPA